MKPTRTLNDKLKYPRTGPSLPLDVSTEILTQTSKISAPFRKVMKRSRQLVIQYPRKDRATYADRLMRFATGRNVFQLQKLVPRYSNVVRDVERELAKPVLHPDPKLDAKYREALQLTLFDAWSHYEACVNEAKRRGALTAAPAIEKPASLARN